MRCIRPKSPASCAIIGQRWPGSAWHQALLRRLVAEQLLLASSTTEGQSGGDVRNSAAPIERNDGRIRLERQATVISYGNAADGIVTTARRSADAPSSDQVLAVFLKADYTLDPISGWDAFGMRGTCSEGFRLVASGASEQILPVGYDKIHAQTMMPVAHLFWSSAWAGIAAARCRPRTRISCARRAALGRHAAAGGRASDARQCDAAHATQPDRHGAAPFRGAPMRQTLETIDFQTGMNLLKVNASELAVATVMSAMQCLRPCRLSQ